MALPVSRVPGTSLPDTPASYDPALERIEIELLLEGIYRHYGFDFRAYAYASIRRRLWKRIEAEGLPSVTALQERVLHEPDMKPMQLGKSELSRTSYLVRNVVSRDKSWQDFIFEPMAQAG